MNNIIESISNDLKITTKQVEVTLKLLEEGNTIPFISRYRKEATGGLDEEAIKSISEVYTYQVNLAKRKEDVIRLIEEKDLMTDELRDSIMASTKLVEVEDLYRPFKEKKKTKATEAIKNGLEPLAKIIMSFPTTFDEGGVSKFLNENVKSFEDAITGANQGENVLLVQYLDSLVRLDEFFELLASASQNQLPTLSIIGANKIQAGNDFVTRRGDKLNSLLKDPDYRDLTPNSKSIVA